MITVTDLHKSFGDFAFELPRFELQEKEYMVILGPTGSGKSLFLNLIGGLLSPDGGSILHGGWEITSVPPEKRGFGVVYQDAFLFPHLTVIENITFGLSVRQIKKNYISAKTEGIMNDLKIDYLRDRSIHGLSGGERQKVAIARALIMEPRLLLLDEPFSSLDYPTKEEMIHFLRRLKADYDLTVVHITHDFEEALRLAHRVALFHQGKMVQCSTPEELFRRPRDLFVAQFIGSKNIFHGRLAGDGEKARFVLDNGRELFVGRGADEPVSYAVIRAEDIILSAEEIHTSATNGILATVTAWEQKRGMVEVHLEDDYGTPFIAFITYRSLESLGLQQQSRAWLYFKASALHLF